MPTRGLLSTRGCRRGVVGQTQTQASRLNVVEDVRDHIHHSLGIHQGSLRSIKKLSQPFVGHRHVVNSSGSEGT